MNSVEKKMYAQRQRGRLACITMLIMVSLLLIFLAMPMLKGPTLLDSEEDLAACCSGSRKLAQLKYHTAEEIGSFIQTETTVHSISMFGGAGYMEAPLASDSRDVKYRVWLLTGDDFQVLYCTPVEFVQGETLPVVYDAQAANASIAEAFGFADGGAYVLFYSRSHASWTLCLAPAVAILLILGYLIWAKHSRRYLMRSQLGREVAKRGDFNTIVRDFDDEKCRFRCDNFEWYNDWILLKHYGGNALEGTFTWILQPANALQEIQVKRDEDEDDQYILFISVKTYGRTFKVYVSGDELKSLPQL